MIRVHADEPKPVLRVKPDSKSNFRRYCFVEAVLSLDPAGKLGLLPSDYKVCCFISWSLVSPFVLFFLSHSFLVYLLLLFFLFCFSTVVVTPLFILLQIAYQIARQQFSNRLKETFLVLSDDEPRPEPQLEARRLSLEHKVQDPRRGLKRRDQDEMSVESSSNAKKTDKTKSAEKSRK